MGVGGQLDARSSRIEARLITAYTGVTRFDSTGWSHPHQDMETWVLDYLNHGQQRQRIGSGSEFLRLSGIAALYAPERDYHEWREDGERLDESFIIFAARGEVARGLRGLVGRQGWCHVQDPQRALGDLLQRLGETLFSRTANFRLLAHGLFCEMLANLMSSEQIEPRLRRAWKEGRGAGRGDLQTRTEQLIRARIAESLRVADLARHLNMSASTFAHVYSGQAGEAPHQTVLRLKMEAAKRLLLDERLSVKETADRLGFSSECYFSRAFKRLEGLAPRHYLAAMAKRNS